MIVLCNCPRCGLEGGLVAMKRDDTGELLLECDECYLAWNHPDAVGKQDGFLAIEIATTPATEDEIRPTGWYLKKDPPPAMQFAIQLVAPDKLQLNTAKPVPRPGPHEILVKIEA